MAEYKINDADACEYEFFKKRRQFKLEYNKKSEFGFKFRNWQIFAFCIDSARMDQELKNYPKKDSPRASTLAHTGTRIGPKSLKGASS